MKRVLSLVLCMMMLMGAAMAGELEWTGEAVWFGDWMEVVKCKEYITLREEPSTKAAELDRIPLGAMVRTLGGYDQKFKRVLYEGQAGYVLSEYLFPAQQTLVAYPEVVVADGSQEAYNIDLFLTNFTEQFFMSPYGYCDAQTLSDQELVEFAIEHIWFNRQDYLEWGEWGVNNVRLSADYIPEVCEKYFGRAPESKLALFKEYFDGYYYWTETGGHVPGGFAGMHRIDCVGVNKYKVEFCVYGMGYGWDESVYGLGEGELWRQHPEYVGESRPYGTAVFTAEDLLDRSSWKLVSLVMDWSW